MWCYKLRVVNLKNGIDKNVILRFSERVIRHKLIQAVYLLKGLVAYWAAYYYC